MDFGLSELETEKIKEKVNADDFMRFLHMQRCKPKRELWRMSCFVGETQQQTRSTSEESGPNKNCWSKRSQSERMQNKRSPLNLPKFK